jgi:hypothetical protein
VEKLRSGGNFASTAPQAEIDIMKLNLHSIVAIGCLVFPLASIAQSPVLPAFSDDNWISLGGSPRANDHVNAAVVDASGNLYIGGSFTAVGETKANFIAKWDGSRWSALGSGVSGYGQFYGHGVFALAVSETGSDLYAGGAFTTAGTKAAAFAARAVLRLPALTLRLPT